MYAIVQTGGKQYKVRTGDIIKVEKLEGSRGNAVAFKDILLVVDESTNTITVGNPLVANACVSGEIQRQTKGSKVIIFKYRRRKNYRKKTGHRQHITEVKIKEITA
jgi:large subunit ribosomal protein L21